MGSLCWRELIYYFEVSKVATGPSAACSRPVDTGCAQILTMYPWILLKEWEQFYFITMNKSVQIKGSGAFTSGCSQSWPCALSRQDKIEFCCQQELGNRNFKKRMAVDKSSCFLPSKRTGLSLSLEVENIRAIPKTVCRAGRLKTFRIPTAPKQEMLL